ncbi:MAG: phosphatidylserine decarboxylase [Chitinophagales bacterium]
MKKFIRYSFWFLVALVVAFLAFYRLWFLRQPARHIPHQASVLVSPANGQIVSVTHWNSASLMVTKKTNGFINTWTKDVDTAGTMISIQMTPMHVHYQRAPSDAVLLAKQHVAGDYNNAINMSNEFGIRHENEHNELLFEMPDHRRYKVIQIAGFVARRIEDYVQPQQSVHQGDVIGLIKLGSQVTILFSHDVDVVVDKGQTVIDGETILGQIRP